MIYVLPVYVLVPLIMYIVCVVVMICLLCSPFTYDIIYTVLGPINVGGPINAGF